MMLFVTSIAFCQEITEGLKGKVESVTVKDTTIANDMKLLIVADRLYSQNGLFDAIDKEVSRQLAETGESKELESIKEFLIKIDNAYKDLVKNFYIINEVTVDPENVQSQIIEIQEWQESVLSNPDIKNATTLGAWESKSNELQKLSTYKKQIELTRTK